MIKQRKKADKFPGATKAVFSTIGHFPIMSRTPSDKKKQFFRYNDDPKTITVPGPARALEMARYSDEWRRTDPTVDQIDNDDRPDGLVAASIAATADLAERDRVDDLKSSMGLITLFISRMYLFCAYETDKSHSVIGDLWVWV
ncbi:hypothetical protein Syun_020996 [Stephania yunnanensis]|uniref:Uncharacterized protein n=1 Tax=Stephania yunnanensis TaxID=152371 RepID=A0AAP0IEW5_9MAGN